MTDECREEKARSEQAYGSGRERVGRQTQPAVKRFSAKVADSWSCKGSPLTPNPHAHNLRAEPVKEVRIFDELGVAGLFVAVGRSSDFLDQITQAEQRRLQGSAIPQRQQ